MPSGPRKYNYWGHTLRERVSRLFRTLLSSRVTPIAASLSHFVVIDRLSLRVRLPVCSNHFPRPHFKWSSLGCLVRVIRHASAGAGWHGNQVGITGTYCGCLPTYYSFVVWTACVRSMIAGEGAPLWPVRQPVPQQLSNEVLTEIIPQPWLMRGSSAANEPQPLLLLRRIKKQLKHPQVSGVFQRQEQKWSLKKLHIFLKPACQAVNRHPNLWLIFISFLISPAVKCWATSVIKKWGSLRRDSSKLSLTFRSSLFCFSPSSWDDSSSVSSGLSDTLDNISTDDLNTPAYSAGSSSRKSKGAQVTQRISS